MTFDPLDAFRLDGRVAVVTGASSGLGVRFARVLTAAGACVAVLARRPERLQAVAASIEGGLAVVADVGDPEQIDAAVAQVLAHFGHIDILVNNAGVGDVALAEEQPIEQFSRALGVNLIGAYCMAQVVGRSMLAHGRGSIINISSILGMVSAGGIPQPGYAASKGGLISLSRELATQWSRRGVRVNALCPGWFESEMTGEMFADDKSLAWIRRMTVLGRPGREGELDGALLWLASDASSYVTGQAIVVDGGFTAM